VNYALTLILGIFIGALIGFFYLKNKIKDLNSLRYKFLITQEEQLSQIKNKGLDNEVSVNWLIDQVSFLKEEVRKLVNPQQT
jgi:uncharacterized membrane protein YciS (DUF1049 family)